MKFLLVIWFLISAFACGKDEKEPVQPAETVTPTEITTESTLKEHLEEFNQNAKAKGVVVDMSKLTSMSFQDTPIIVLDKNGKPIEGDILAVCYRKINKETQETTNARIVFSRAEWNEMAPIYRSYTTHHELGHCVLNRQHYDNWFMVDFNYYTSIMSTGVDLSYPEGTMKDWPILLDELFHPQDYHGTNLKGETFAHDGHCFVTPDGEEACPIFSGKVFQ